jgi:hypothetical protein
MIRAATSLVGFFMTLAMCPLMEAAVVNSAANPYGRIANANIFGLKPVEIVHVDPPPIPLPRIALTGITTMPGGKRVWLKVQYPAQPPDGAKAFSCVLVQGQREGELEVLEIDEVAGRVRLNVSGTIMVLSFGNDSRRNPVAHFQPPVQR